MGLNRGGTIRYWNAWLIKLRIDPNLGYQLDAIRAMTRLFKGAPDKRWGSVSSQSMVSLSWNVGRADAK